MDTTLLRTLTFKSSLRFGEYYDLTVDEVIRYKGIKGIKFLTWAYYKSSKISFVQNVLDALGITKQNEIDKPGKCNKEELHAYMDSAMFTRVNNEDLTPEQLEQRSRMNRKKTYAIKKTKTRARKAWTFRNQDKESNQYRNQHKYTPIQNPRI